jgi:hypothetical protein
LFVVGILIFQKWFAVDISALFSIKQLFALLFEKLGIFTQSLWSPWSNWPNDFALKRDRL